ncbi:MAG: hypothetical protein P4M08_01385 [Oligoflexia bacterium]|nr:hypothetical protein [Oligoflexia bacterium]
MKFNLDDFVFDYYLSKATPTEFKVFCRLLRHAEKSADGVVELPQSDITYHCDLSPPTVIKALQELVKLKAIAKLPYRSFHTEQRFKVVSGNTLNVVDDQTDPVAAQNAAAVLSSLNLTQDQMNVIRFDLEDDHFKTWHATADIPKIKEELGVSLSYDLMRQYFTKNVFPHIALSDQEVLETYHLLKGEGRL